MRLLAALLLIAWAPSALAQSGGFTVANFPVVSPAVEVLPPNVFVSSQQAVDTPTVRVGNTVYITYKSFRESQVETGIVYVRPFSTISRQPGAAVRVFTQAEPGETTVHNMPSLARDGLGTLLPLWGWTRTSPSSSSGSTCYGSACFGTARTIPNLLQPGGWGPEPPTGGLRGRLVNTFGLPPASCATPVNGCGTFLYDYQAVYEPLEQITYLGAEGAFPPATLDGTATGTGLHRFFYRISTPFTAPASFHGPFIVVDAPQFAPIPGQSCSGNVFAKGSYRVGREPTAPRSVSLVWTIRHTFRMPSCASAFTALWTYNRYFAKSTDRGDTWCNLLGTVCTPLTERIDFNDPAYLLEAGEFRQDEEFGWNIDGDGFVHLLMNRHDGDTSDFTPGTTHVDWDGDPDNDGANVVTPGMNLMYARWSPTGVRLESTVQANHGTGHNQVIPGRHRDLYVFAEQPVRMKVSDDYGASWSAWRNIDNNTRTRRATIVEDQVERGLFHMVYQDFQEPFIDIRLFWVPIRLF